MENVLVTGGAGYLGSIMVPELLAKGYKVTVLDNFMFKQNSLAHVCLHPNFEIIRGDIRNKELIRGLMKDVDVIIPLAALVGAPLCSEDPIGAATINHDAIKMMFDLSSSDQVILMPTTNSAYGTGDENNFCTEDSELRPISEYAIGKVEIEKMLLEMENSISFRLATVFGMSPRMRLDLLVNDFTYRAFRDKSVVLFESHFKRNYIHVRDVTNVFLHALENHKNMKGEIYNVGLSEANLSKKELCQAIQKRIPGFTIMEAKVGKDPDQRNYIVSNDKVERTGFKTSHSLDDGIKELVKGYKMINNNRYGNV